MKKYLYYFDFSKCSNNDYNQDTISYGCYEEKICIDKCPENNFNLYNALLNNERIEKIRDEMICKSDFDKSTIVDGETAKTAVDNRDCVGAYVATSAGEWFIFYFDILRD